MRESGTSLKSCDDRGNSCHFFSQLLLSDLVHCVCAGWNVWVRSSFLFSSRVPAMSSAQGAFCGLYYDARFWRERAGWGWRPTLSHALPLHQNQSTQPAKPNSPQTSKSRMDFNKWVTQIHTLRHFTYEILKMAMRLHRECLMLTDVLTSHAVIFKNVKV